MRPFQELLRRHIKAAGFTHERFAKLAGVSPALVSLIINRKCRPGTEYDERWSDVLGLSGQEREEFIDAMHIAAATTRIATIVSRLERQIKSR